MTSGKYYLIGEGHKEFLPDKIWDEDYYILTLAAVAKELRREKLNDANVILAAGLPLTWTSGQKKDFAAYLSKKKKSASLIRRRITALHMEKRRYWISCRIRLRPPGLLMRAPGR